MGCTRNLFESKTWGVDGSSGVWLPFLQLQQRCLLGGWLPATLGVVAVRQWQAFPTAAPAACGMPQTAASWLWLTQHPPLPPPFRRLLAEAECRRTGASTVPDGPLIFGHWFDNLFHPEFQPASALGQPYLVLGPGLLEMTQVGRAG